MLSISDLSTEDVTQAELLLVEFLQTEYPSMDLSKGTVFRDLIIRPAALTYTLNEENLDRLRRSFSLQQISEEPTLANDDIVDGVLSNLLLTRDDGASASGQLRVILTDKVTTSIDNDVVFTSNGLNYVPTRGFVGVTDSANVVNAGSRLITQRTDGNYEFIVDVQAAVSGDSGNAAEGTRFTASVTINRLIDIVAAGDFSGGRTPEDNATLAARAQSGLSPQVLSGRSHIESLLSDQFSDLHSLSIIGYGDTEMTRDQHNLFSVSQGGKVDIYARTAVIPQRTLLTVTATMLDASSGQKLLTVSLDRDTMAGAYDVLAAYAEGVTPFQLVEEAEPSLVDSLEIVSKSWSYNATATGDEFVPDIATAAEAAFTRYRTMVLQFKDPSSTLANGETATYQVYLLKLPDVADIQDFVNSRERRGPAADYLVRAPVPAICSVGIVVKARDIGEIDTDGIKTAIVSRVSALGFSVGYLPASVIIDAAQGQLPSDAVLDLPINMQAKMYLPDGTTAMVNATDELRVPNSISDVTVSARTVAWFLRTSDVDVSVKEISTPEV